MTYQNSLNDPCVNCKRESCKGCEYILGLSRDYGVSKSEAKNIRDYIFETGENEEDAVDLIAKKGLRGILTR